MKTEKENLRIVAFALAMSVLVACTGSETGTPREASGTAPKGAQSENLVPPSPSRPIGRSERVHLEIIESCKTSSDFAECYCKKRNITSGSLRFVYNGKSVVCVGGVR